MPFYDLDKNQRQQLVEKIGEDLLSALKKNSPKKFIDYFGDEDTYIRKAAYLNVGKIFDKENKLTTQLKDLLEILLSHKDFKIRQTVINTAGEIGKKHFDQVQLFFDKGLKDAHHAPRNAVIGSIKKMGEVNPVPVLKWAETYLHHLDKEIRREICHGIELRGRKYPEDILPLLRQLEHDSTSRVRNTLVHVIGQISYKKGCLQTVVADLKKWENKALVDDALLEIIDVHHRYRNFAVLTQQEAREYIEERF